MRTAHRIEKSASRAERCGFGNATHFDSRDGLRTKMFLDRFRQITCGQNHVADFLLGEIAHDPFDERPAIHGSHWLGQIAEQMFDARAETARENHGGDLVGGNTHGDFVE